MERKKIAIIGVGLIGGSLAIRLHEKKLSSLLIGVDADPKHANQAMEMELVDEIVSLEEAIAEAEVIALAIPVNQILEILPAILDKLTDQIVFDMGSTKWEIVRSLQGHPKRGRFVATHPMWGTEYSGPKAAVKDAFDQKAVIICNGSESDEDALRWVKNMYQKIGMHILEMEAGAHDLHAAYVSHISHITSFALANTVLKKEKQENAIFEMASAGFESTVRLAKSNPSMWLPILLQNREHVLDVLNEHIVQLEKFRTSIERSDEAELLELMQEANRIKRIIQ